MMDGSTGSGIFGILDESIFVREARRWRNQKRWSILAAAWAICTIVAVPLVLNLSSGGVCRPIDIRLLGVLARVVAGCSALAAFIHSMQVLRQEAGTGTLGSLFLTLQRSRGVVASVVAVGIAAGVAVLVPFAVVIVGSAWLLEIPLVNTLSSLCLILGTIMAAAALGGIWFFVAQKLFPIRRLGLRVAMSAAGAFLCLAGYPLSQPHPLPDVMSRAVAWTMLFWGMGCAAYWSLLSVAKERHRTSDRDREYGPNTVDITVALSLAAALAYNLSAVAMRPASIGLDSKEGFEAINPVVVAGCILDFSARGSTRMSLDYDNGGGPDYGGTVQHPSQLGVGADSYGSFDPYPGASLPARPAAAATRAESSNVSIIPVSVYGFLLAALFALLAAGLTCKTFRLYAWLREFPELAGNSHILPLRTADIGQDSWSGFRNPILTRELRSRLRSGDARAFVAVAALLSCAAFLIPLIGSIGSQIEAPRLAELARSSFVAVCMMQLVIIALIGPGLGSEAIANEKEKKTWDMLVASRLSTKDILKGKISGSICLLMLLLSPSLPLLALTAFLHGVDIWTVLFAIVLCAFFVLLIAVTSVSISGLTRTSISGKWTAYLLSAALLAGFCALVPNLTIDNYTDGLPAVAFVLLAAVTIVSIPALALTSFSGKWTVYRWSVGLVAAALCALPLLIHAMYPSISTEGLGALILVLVASLLTFLLFNAAVARIKRKDGTPRAHNHIHEFQCSGS